MAKQTPSQMAAEIKELKAQLAEAEDAIRAIREGEVDAIVTVKDQVYTLKGADTIYRAVVEQMPEGVLSLSDDGTILYSNGHMAARIGQPLEKVIGTAFIEYLAPENQPVFKKMLKNPGHVETEIITRDGTRIPVHLETGKTVMDHSSVNTLIVTDISQFKMQERINRAKDEFIGLVSHELRNPLTVIIGSLQTALGGGVSEADIRLLMQNAAEGATAYGVRRRSETQVRRRLRAE